MMSEDPGLWNIRDVADLILGAGMPQTPPNGYGRTHDGVNPPNAAGPPANGQDRPATLAVALLCPDQDAVRALGQYGDYLANRGQGVAVLWVGDAGVKFGFFDCRRRDNRVRELVDALECGCFEAVPDLLAGVADRVVLAYLTTARWHEHAATTGAQEVCVVLGPSRPQLIHGYEALKAVATHRPQTPLACFVTDATSADQATAIGDRLREMGEKFIRRPVTMRGFGLHTKEAPATLIGETYVTRRDDLLAVIGPGRPAAGESLPRLSPAARATSRASPPEVEAGTPLAVPAVPAAGESNAISPLHVPYIPVETPTMIDPSKISDRKPPQPQPPARCGLPRVSIVRWNQPVASAADLDRFVAERVHEVLDDAVDSWPLLSPGSGECCLRFVRCAGGGRMVVVSTVENPAGALEQATACLHPAAQEDVIVLLAPHLQSELRRAARGVIPATRLYEISQLPEGHDAGVVLKEVGNSL